MNQIQTTWGKLPNDVLKELNQRYWQNLGRFKQLLNHEISQENAIEITLKPPSSGKVAAQNTLHFQAFVKAWQIFETQHPNSHIQLETKNLGFLGEQSIPVKLIIHDLNTLAEILGKVAIERLDSLQFKFKSLVQLSPNPDTQKRIFDSLINHLDMIERLSNEQIANLVILMPQLYEGMGKGNYLRAVNVAGIDTKFIENNFRTIEILVQSLHQTDTAIALDTIDENNQLELLDWLGCESKPKDWLFIRPLCDASKLALANLPILKLSSQTLLNFELPADNILIIENETPCFMLPNLANTIAVAGGGKNLTWLKAQWLKHKKVGYWGDIDSEGLAMLSYARKCCAHVESLMMDKHTLGSHDHKRVAEPVFNQVAPKFLTIDEAELFAFIQQQDIDKRRLEQEFIHQDVILQVLKNWVLGLKI